MNKVKLWLLHEVAGWSAVYRDSRVSQAGDVVVGLSYLGL